MKLAGYGRREWGGAAAVALGVGALGAWAVAGGYAVAGWTVVSIAALAWLALAAFFRVPNRTIVADPAVLVSPADGVVRDIGTVKDHGIELFEGRELLRIGIFLSVFDVHVNRAPCAWKVEYRKYKEGRFLDARDPRCAKENESLVIAGTGSAAGREFPVAVRQVSGAIARRIVCEPEPGAVLGKGAIYGMIKFGSRTELYLPANAGISSVVRVGDRVRSGTTAIARID